MYDREFQNNFRLQVKLKSYERSRTYSRPEQNRLQRKSIAKHLSYANIKPSTLGKSESLVQTSQGVDNDQAFIKSTTPEHSLQNTQENFNTKPEPSNNPSIDMRPSIPTDGRVSIVSKTVSPNVTPNISVKSNSKLKTAHRQNTKLDKTVQHMTPKVAFKGFSKASLNTLKKSSINNKKFTAKTQSKPKTSYKRSLFVPKVISEGSSKIYNIAKTAIFLVKNPITNLERANSTELEAKVRYGILGNLKFNAKAFPDNFRLSNIVLYGMASILFLSGMGVVYNGFMTNRRVNAAIVDGATPDKVGSGSSKKSKSIGGLSVEKPSNNYVQQYTVAPDLPKYIKIDKLGINAVILAMGVDSKNKLEAPNNIYNAGWYNGSSRPGESGGMLLEGHSGIGNYPGIFGHLDNLNKGDTIQVVRGDNKVFTYKVVDKKIFDVKKVDMGSMMVSKNPDKPGLNLITCFGEATPGTTEFSHRQIVYAVQQ